MAERRQKASGNAEAIHWLKGLGLDGSQMNTIFDHPSTIYPHISSRTLETETGAPEPLSN